MFLAKINVFLKKSVADPQGVTVQHALASLGYQNVEDVRVGKYLELSLDSTDAAVAELEVKAMCEKLLVNLVIEDYSFEISELS